MYSELLHVSASHGPYSGFQNTRNRYFKNIKLCVGIRTNPVPMDCFWYCRYPNGTARVSSADINSWTPLSKIMRRFSRNSVCSTNFMKIRHTVYSLVLGQKLSYVRTDVIFTYGTHFYFLKTWLVETCGLLFIHSFTILSDDRSKASSKTVPLRSAI